MLLILFTAHITSATAETYLSLSIKPKKNQKKIVTKISKRDQTALLLRHIEPEM